MKDDIVKEAQKRFQECEDREADNRKLWAEDLKFANGDSDNGYQWDEAQYRERRNSNRPCITINKVKQHNRQITNEARQNKPSIRVSPVDDGADKEVAEVFNGIIRHIESQSSADTAYDTANEYAVDAGLGYWRVITDYADDTSANQEIYIKAVRNPLNVYLGPHDEADGSDMRYGFVFDDLPNDEFKSLGYDIDAGADTFGNSSWANEETTRVCEYFRVVEKHDKLIFLPDGSAVKLSEVEDKKSITGLKSRPIKIRTVEWYLLGGNEVLEKKEWLGKYIPIVRVVGSEVTIDGKTVRSGHTRAIKDPQRIYNYWSSSTVEFVALQGKQPYLAAAEAVEGYEDKWGAINTSNDPFVPYNHMDDAGNPIPVPTRQQPPVMAQAYIQGMQIASDEMKAASGQYDAQFGENANQQSGRALNALQRKGDNATFHFVDNVARAIKYTGIILVDLIPKVFDTNRVIRILGEDGSEDTAQINPEQPAAVNKQRNMKTGAIEKIYNPSVGRYDVTVHVGQNYGTRRQEGALALTELVRGNPQLMQIAGDILMKTYDFPYADELSERLEKTIPPELMKKDGDEDDGQQQPQIPPEVQQHLQDAETMIKSLDETIQKMQEELDSKDGEKYKIQSDIEAAKRKLEIDQFNAETNRMKVEIDAKSAMASMAAAQSAQNMPEPDGDEISDQEDVKEMDETDLLKLELEIRKMELEIKKIAHEEQFVGQPDGAAVASIESQLSPLLLELTQAFERIGQLSAIAAGPRRSELQLDKDGMPIGSISYPIDTAGE